MPKLPKVDATALQESLDLLLPRRELLRGDEVAKALSVDLRTLIRLFEDRKLLGHELNAAEGERQHRRYRRASVLLYLATTANYTPEDLRLRTIEVLEQLPLSDKALIYQRLGAQLRSL